MDTYKYEVRVYDDNDRLEVYHYITFDALSREEADALVNKHFSNEKPELIQIDNELTKLLLENKSTKRNSKRHRKIFRRT